MACKYCGKEIDDHAFLSFRCPRYTTDGLKVGYIDGQEY